MFLNPFFLVVSTDVALWCPGVTLISSKELSKETCRRSSVFDASFRPLMCRCVGLFVES